MHGRTVHPRALDYESLYKGCEGEIPHFSLSFSLFSFLFPMLSPLSSRVLLFWVGYEDSDESSSSPAEVSWVPAAVGRPVRRHHRVGTLICFLFRFYSEFFLFYFYFSLFST